METMARERTDYPLNYGNGSQHPHDSPHDLADAVTDRVKEVTDNLQERAGQVADQALQYAEMAQDAVKQFKPFVQKSLKEQPMTTLASFVLVGFVLGALWKK
jgi:ElaB/YqjD/DUF883 family membrane-anchored ribosome-binding protein